MSLRLHEQQGHRRTASRDGAVEAMMEGGGWSASLDAETSGRGGYLAAAVERLTV